MKIETEELKIVLQNQCEIRDFWNIIEFALDLQAIRDKEGKSCMTEDELKMAKYLAEITKGY